MMLLVQLAEGAHSSTDNERDDDGLHDLVLTDGRIVPPAKRQIRSRAKAAMMSVSAA